MAIVPASLPIERWDDVSAVSDSYTVAGDRIATRLPDLFAPCKPATNGALKRMFERWWQEHFFK